MSMNSKGLGRGLNALFQAAQTQNESSLEENVDSPFQNIAIESIVPNAKQPRENFSESSIKELADSIKERGVLQPIIVRPSQAGMYEIIAGERRWRASKVAGLTHIPAIIKNLDDNEIMIVALIENIQREDLNPIEQAKGLMALKEKLGISQDALAEKLGKQSSVISNTLRLIKLTEEAQQYLIDGKISVGHARCILNVTQGECADDFLKHIIETNMQVNEAEQAVSFWRTEDRFPWQKEKINKIGKKSTKNPDMTRIEKEVGALLNCKAHINGNIDQGRITLNYETNEQLYDLLEKLGLSLTTSG